MGCLGEQNRRVARVGREDPGEVHRAVGVRHGEPGTEGHRVVNGVLVQAHLAEEEDVLQRAVRAVGHAVADQDQAVAGLLEAAQKNATALANAAAGIGTQLDISV